MSKNNRKVETNQMKIFKEVCNTIFPRYLFLVWFFLSVLIFCLRVLAYFIPGLNLNIIPMSVFIFPGVTGLSFTITLLNATRNIFETKDLADIFSYTDSDNPTEGYLYYRTIAPYLTASFIWLLVSLIALIGSMFYMQVHFIILEVFYSLFYMLVIAGLLNLWFLVTTHLKDISNSLELELIEREKLHHRNENDK